MTKVIDMARVLGMPDTTTEAEVYIEIFRLQRIIEERQPASAIVALAKARGGDIRSALLSVAAERPDLVARWRQQPRLATHLDLATDAEKTAALAALAARVQK